MATVIPINYRSMNDINIQDYEVKYSTAMFLAKLMDKVNHARFNDENVKAEIYEEILELALNELKVKVHKFEDKGEQNG